MGIERCCRDRSRSTSECIPYNNWKGCRGVYFSVWPPGPGGVGNNIERGGKKGVKMHIFPQLVKSMHIFSPIDLKKDRQFFTCGAHQKIWISNLICTPERMCERVYLCMFAPFWLTWAKGCVSVSERSWNEGNEEKNKQNWFICLTFSGWQRTYCRTLWETGTAETPSSTRHSRITTGASKKIAQNVKWGQVARIRGAKLSEIQVSHIIIIQFNLICFPIFLSHNLNKPCTRGQASNGIPEHYADI